MTTPATPPIVRIGFLPLADAAVVIAAATGRFDRAHGVSIELSRENSWASLRDKLVVGLIDAAHILAPLAMATHLGVGHLHKPLVAPLRLSLDGNTICVSNRLYDALMAEGFSRDPADFARALGKVAQRRAAAGDPALTFATVFPASSHHALIRRLVTGAGLVEGADVRLAVLAPPLMVDALASGVIDGFCVGAPWGGFAVHRGVGHIVAASAQFGSGRTEKLLVVTADWAEAKPDTLRRLVATLTAAGDWCAAPANHAALAITLAAPQHIGLPAEVIARSLSGRLVMDPGGAPTLIPRFLSLGGSAVSRPDTSHAGQLLEEIGEPVPQAALPEAATLFRSGLFES